MFVAAVEVTETKPEPAIEAVTVGVAVLAVPSAFLRVTSIPARSVLAVLTQVRAIAFEVAL